MRRQVFLLFKESVSNAAKHSGCEQMELVFSIDGGQLSLVVADDGNGFDTAASFEGNGLASMRRRADELGGRLGIDSSPETGTRVTLLAPLRKRRRG